MSRIKDYFKQVGSKNSSDPFAVNEARANINMAMLMCVLTVFSIITLIMILVDNLSIQDSGAICLAIGTALILGPSILTFIKKGDGVYLKYLLTIHYLFYAAIVRTYIGDPGVVMMVLAVLMAARYYDKRFSIIVIATAAVAFVTSQCGFAFTANPDPTIGGISVQIFPIPGKDYYDFEVEPAKRWDYLYAVWKNNGFHNFLLFLFGSVVAYTITFAGRALVKEKSDQAVKESAIHNELVMAQRIQLSMLPKSFPLFPDYEDVNAYAITIPAKEVGGDFYDAFKIDDEHVGFLVADVSGKGIPAAMFMALAKAIIKTQAVSSVDPGVTFDMVNKTLREGNDVNFFVTAWFGVMNTKTNVLKYVNAGHNPPLFARINNRYEFLTDISGPVLTAVEDCHYKVFSLDLQKGDRLFLYTDGVTEAENNDGEQYGAKRLKDLMNTHERSSIRALVRAVKNSVKEFTEDHPQSDDMTILMFEYGAYSKSFDANDENIPLIISSCRRYLKKYGAGDRAVSQFDVVLDEALANICHYAYEEGQTGHLNVSMFVDDNKKFTLVLSDQGKPFNPLEKEDPDITLSSKNRKIGGLGIYMVKKLVDTIDYYRFENENVLVLTKKIN
ncbi:MAG: SpoIIE family protein phosphatase [Bacilli bacterium]|nr:SpoIIE family protein phosphatase [Bacilli bacterium]